MTDNRKTAEAIVGSLLNGEIERGKCFSTSLRRIETWDLPFIDFAYQDSDTKKTVSILFQNIFSDDDEVKANTIKALNSFDAVIVAFEVQSMNKADYFVQQLKKEGLLKLPIGVLIYDANGNISVLETFEVPKNVSVRRTEKEKKSYWCWWRDGSQYEVATLLELSYKYNNETGDIYTNKVYPEFFDLMIAGNTKTWDGSPRKKVYSVASYKSEKQNYKIPMCQLGLWDAKDGHITDKGLTLLDVIRTYGSDSKEYFDCLAKLILIDGKHLDLVKDLDDFQKASPELIPASRAEFYVLFDDYMMRKGSIGTRKPAAVKTGAKQSYVRDETKLWNKMGIIKNQRGNRYYRPFVGIEIDWERINEILLSDVFGGKDE